MQLKKIIIADHEGNEHAMPSHYVVCDRCEGHGTHDHQAFSNGITSSEWAGMEPDDRDSYMAGAYDVQCESCDGNRVILVIDDERLTDEQRTLVDDAAQAERELAAEHLAEMRYGC